MQFNFWNGWPRSLQLVWGALMVLLLVLVLAVLYFDLQGFNNYINWQVIGQQVPIGVSWLSVNIGIQDFPIEPEAYLLYETYSGGPPFLNQTAYLVYLAALVVVITTASASITYLPRTWNIILTVILAVAFWFLDFGILGVFGLEDQTVFVLVTVSYVAMGYYFRTLKPYMDFVQRLSGYFVVTVGWGLLIANYSTVSDPLLLLAANGFLVFYLVAIVFIMMVSHEILHFILLAISRPGHVGGSNLRRFSLFALLYLVNVTLLLLYDLRVINWKFYYLNPYVLLAISTILGIWGLQTRKILFKSVEHYPILVYMYMVMALCCFGVLGLFLGTYNDPVLQVIKDVIIYSHFGFGSIFFIYVVSNFMGLLQKNVPVEKVVYKPRNMPHFTFRFAGLMVVLGFALKENIEVPVQQTISGRYNNLGDYYLHTDNREGAVEAFTEGKIYGYMNHKSNYTLGKLYEFRDIPQAVEHFSNATQVRPSPMAYVNLSTSWSKSGDLFNSLFILNDGQQQFPASPEILNNKGYLFHTLNITDSAMLYLDAAYRAGHQPSPVSNYLGTLAETGYHFSPDSILQTYDVRSTAAVTNALGLRLVQNNTERFETDEEVNPALSLYSASQISNTLLNQYLYLDSTRLNALQRSSLYEQNTAYSDLIRYSVALAYYQKGHLNKSIDLLESLGAISSPRQSNYQYTIGLIKMENHDYKFAVDHLAFAASTGYPNSSTLLGMAYYMTNRQDTARLIWTNSVADSVRNHQLLQDVDDPASLASLMFDTESPGDLVLQKIQTIPEGRQRDQLCHFLARRHLNRGDLLLARSFLDLVGQNVQGLNRTRIELARAFGDDMELEEGPDDLILLTRIRFDPQDSTLYRSLGRINAYNSEAVLRSAEFLQQFGEPMEAYNILIDALRYNRESVPILEMYVKECLRQNLSTYALNGLKTLHQLVDTEHYNEFILQNRQQLSEVFSEESDEF